MAGYKKNKYNVINNDFTFLKNQGLKPEHKILDIGCGGGRLGNNLISYLNKENYYGLDKEIKMINYFNNSLNDNLKSKNPNILLQDLNLNFGDIKFDFIYAYSVLTHITKEEYANLLNELKSYIKPSTKIYFTFLIGKKYFKGDKHEMRKNEYDGIWYSIDDVINIGTKQGYNVSFIGDDNKNWENVERKLYDNSISVSKYGNGTFSPFLTKKCLKNFKKGGECFASPHTHGSHQEMFLIIRN